MESADARQFRESAREQIATGRFEEALRDADRAVSAAPDNAAAHTLRAVALSRLNRNDEALAAFQEALRLEPGSARRHFNVASQLVAMGRDAEALQYALDAQRLDANLENLQHLLQRFQPPAPAPPQPPPPQPPSAQWDALQPPEPAQPPPGPVYGVPGPPYGTQPPAGYMPELANTSGRGAAAVVPHNVGGWNWGAFFLTPIWTIAMRLHTIGWLVLLAHIGMYVCFAVGVAGIMGPVMDEIARAAQSDTEPNWDAIRGSESPGTTLAEIGGDILGLASLVAAVWLGVAGSGMAWRARRFQGVEHFFDVQRKWMYWGIGLFAFTLCCAFPGACLGFFTWIVGRAAGGVEGGAFPQ